MVDKHHTHHCTLTTAVHGESQTKNWNYPQTSNINNVCLMLEHGKRNWICSLDETGVLLPMSLALKYPPCCANVEEFLGRNSQLTMRRTTGVCCLPTFNPTDNLTHTCRGIYSNSWRWRWCSPGATYASTRRMCGLCGRGRRSSRLPWRVAPAGMSPSCTTFFGPGGSFRRSEDQNHLYNVPAWLGLHYKVVMKTQPCRDVVV